MKGKLSVVPLLFLSVLMTLVSCKKKNTGLPTNCNLAGVSDSTTSVLSATAFTYDNNNRLQTITITGQRACRKVFTYSGSNIIIMVTDTTAGVFMETDTVTLNGMGLIQVEKSYFPSLGTTETETFTYDASGNVLNSVESDGISSDTVIYSSSNGDLNYDILSGHTNHNEDYILYPSQNIIFGDPTDLNQLLDYGAYYYRNKHMLKEYYVAGSTYESFQYITADNRLAQAIIMLWNTGSDTTIHYHNYTYSCK